MSFEQEKKVKKGSNVKVTSAVPIIEEDQNQTHNTKKESLGPNTKR